jgi:hypothetical protein
MSDRGRMLGLTAAAVLFAACGDDGGDHPCADGGCICEEENLCQIDCDADDCLLDCAGASICDLTCGDFCEYSCVDSSECYLGCGDACAATCDSVSVCEIDCGDDCDVVCDSLSACRVTMLSGVAVCTSVSECTIDCVVPGGLEAAEDCGDGLFACGGCP